MNDIRNCRRCGKMFDTSSTKKPICPECVKKEDEEFEIARVYIKEHPGVNIKEVAAETGVNERLLIKFVREKRLEFADGSGPILVCEKCGIPVSSGRFCNTCLGKLGKAMIEHSSADVAKFVEKTMEQPNKGMHYTRKQ